MYFFKMMHPQVFFVPLYTCTLASLFCFLDKKQLNLNLLKS